MKYPTYHQNDLIYFHTGYYINGRTIYQYCKIIDIIQNNQSLNKIKLITGSGDKNTKVEFLLKIIGEETNPWRTMNSTPNTNVNQFTHNPKDTKIDKQTIKTSRIHDIWEININEAQNITNQIISSAQNKLLFLKQHQNRNLKIDLLLEEGTSRVSLLNDK